VKVQLRLLIATSAAAAAVMLTAAVVLLPIRSSIEPPLGLAFWVALTLVASALPVRLPAGTQVSVGVAPLMASVILGGPAAAGLVGLLGTFDARELKGRIPWYGTVSNHANIVIPAVIAGLTYDVVAFGLSGVGMTNPEPAHPLRSFLALSAAGIAHFTINAILAGLVVLGLSRREFR
jgi:hypothetical protein